MASNLLPVTILPALGELQMTLQQSWADDMPDEGIPIDFWTIRDDALFFDALQYLPNCMYLNGGPLGEGHSDADLASLPNGFQLVTSMFELEDQFAFDGWTAIHNLGAEKLSRVVDAYVAVGLPRRAAALRRVLDAYLLTPEDDEGDNYRAVAQGELPDLIDDEDSCAVVLAYLRSDPETLFGVLP